MLPKLQCYECNATIIGSGNDVDGNIYCNKCFNEMNAIIDFAEKEASKVFADEHPEPKVSAFSAPTKSSNMMAMPLGSDSDLKSMFMANYRARKSPAATPSNTNSTTTTNLSPPAVPQLHNSTSHKTADKESSVVVNSKGNASLAYKAAIANSSTSGDSQAHQPVRIKLNNSASVASEARKSKVDSNLSLKRPNATTDSIPTSQQYKPKQVFNIHYANHSNASSEMGNKPIKSMSAGPEFKSSTAFSGNSVAASKPMVKTSYFQQMMAQSKLAAMNKPDTSSTTSTTTSSPNNAANTSSFQPDKVKKPSLTPSNSNSANATTNTTTASQTASTSDTSTQSSQTIAGRTNKAASISSTTSPATNAVHLGAR
jgi:hypothetical protein